MSEQRSAVDDTTTTEVVWGVRFPESKGGGEYDQQSEDFARRRVAEFPWMALLRRKRTTRTVVTETEWETVIPPAATEGGAR